MAAIQPLLRCNDLTMTATADYLSEEESSTESWPIISSSTSSSAILSISILLEEPSPPPPTLPPPHPPCLLRSSSWASRVLIITAHGSIYSLCRQLASHRWHWIGKTRFQMNEWDELVAFGEYIFQFGGRSLNCCVLVLLEKIPVIFFKVVASHGDRLVRRCHGNRRQRCRYRARPISKSADLKSTPISR